MKEIYVENIDREKRIVTITIPEWSKRQLINMPLKGFPLNQISRRKDRKLYAEVNTEAVNQDELNIKFFERDFWNDR